MLSVFLTEELERHTQNTEDAGLLFYFCSHQSERRNSAAAVFRSLAYQILSRHRALFSRISSYFENGERKKATLSSAEALWIVLRTLLQAPETRTVFCVLDGLDECDKTSQRLITSKLCEPFSDNLGSSNGKLTLGIVSRPIAGLESFTQVKLDPDNDGYVNDDIRHFISSGVRLLRLPGFDEDKRKIVEESLLRRAQGTFLWAGFVMRELSTKATCTEIMETLDSLPSGLPRMYSQMLRQIDPRRRPVISGILRWVTLAFELLSLRDLASAVGVQASQPPDVDQIVHDYIAMCGGILKKTGDKVTLVHQSAKDYLLQDQVDNDPIHELFRIRPEEGHADLTTTCLDCIERSPLGIMSYHEFLEAVPEPPLLPYAVRYWPHHARNSRKHVDWGVELERAFFGPTSTTRENWAKALDLIRPEKLFFSGRPVLHLACAFGVYELVQQLLSKRRYGKTPGSRQSHQVAERKRRTELFETLRGLMPRGRGATASKSSFPSSVAQKDVYGNTALFYAVHWERGAVVQLLLKNKAHINEKNHQGRTPLYVATQAKSTAMARLLLENGADANAKAQDRRTALMCAAFSGDNMPMVRLLLEHGAEVGTKDTYPGHTALWGAIHHKHEAMVQLLVDRGADVNEKYDDSPTSPLGLAVAFSDSPAIVRLLLERGARARSPAGREALDYAIDGQNTAAVRVLLEWGADLGECASQDWTLVTTARGGNEELVRLLIEHGADINVVYKGCTPLGAARNGGNAGVVQLLESAGAHAYEYDQKANLRFVLSYSFHFCFLFW